MYLANRGESFLLMILACCFASLIVGCPRPLKDIKFDMGGQPVKKYTTDFFDGKLQLELRGYYFWTGPELDLRLKITAKHKNVGFTPEFRPNDISLSFDGKLLDWHDPQFDSLYLVETDEKFVITIGFRRTKLTEADIEYLRDTQFPLRISLGSFLTANGKAIHIDTIYATSPELTYYGSWQAE